MSEMLKGVRVLDITQAYSGPFCAMHLADHGAEVIKVESPAGDQSRGWGPYYNDYSTYFAAFNRNKKGLVLNLKTEAGKEALRRLIRVSDVVLENFRPGKFAELGFSWDEIHTLNPRIIYASISGFGHTGPLSPLAAYDIIAQGESGMMTLNGNPDEGPLRIGPCMGDSYTGTFASLGIVMALYEREKTGEGRRIDVAMADTMLAVEENWPLMYTIFGKNPTSADIYHSAGDPWDSFETSDGNVVINCGTEAHWPKLCHVMGLDDLIDNPDYATFEDRRDHYRGPGQLRDQIHKYTKKHTSQEVIDALAEVGVPCGHVNTVAQWCDSDQTRARNMIWNLYEPGFGEKVRVVGTPIKVQGETDEPFKGSPLQGEDDEEILSSLAGFTAEEIEQMRKDGVTK